MSEEAIIDEQCNSDYRYLGKNSVTLSKNECVVLFRLMNTFRSFRELNEFHNLCSDAVDTTKQGLISFFAEKN